MIAEIQCLPTPAGTAEAVYAHVDAAIAEVASSGLTYEVGALGTTVEGSDDEVWSLLRRAHEATLHAGAAQCVTVVKIVSSADGGGLSMHGLVAGHR